MAKINWTLRTFRLDELTDYYKNPRSLSEKEFKQLKTSLDKFGMIDKPIVNADAAHTVIGGHQRKHVLEASGVEECECWIPDRELSEKEVEELNIRLNKNTGSFDFDILANEFELDDLLDWGFDKGELDLDLWAEDAPEDVEPQIDKAEELQEKWNVQVGQVWQLGEHRLICGDCTDKAVVERVMQGERADIVFTDPPYGIDLINNDKGKVGGGTKEYPTKVFETIYGDDKPFDPTHLLSVASKAVIWGGNYFANKLPNSRCWFIWYKKHPVDRTFAGCELAWTNIDKHSKVYECAWDGWTKEGESGSKVHPSQKPIKLCVDILSDIEGLIVADYYIGSGTTIIACERLGRKCRAVEISPAYVAVAIQRWVDVTGKEPVLLDT